MVISKRAVVLAAVVTVAMVIADVRAQPTRPRATLTPLAETDGQHAGATVLLALRVDLPPGLHVQSDKPRDPALIPTVLTLEPPKGVAIAAIDYPPSTDLAQAGQAKPLAVFEQQFVIAVRATIDASVAPGEIVMPARLRYQACDDQTCYIPAREETAWKLRVVPAGITTPRQHDAVFLPLRSRR